MDLSKITSFALITLLFLTIHARNDCAPRFCKNNPLQIRFPFRLEGHHPQKCGYPGFDLDCSGEGAHLVLTLPESGDFWVREINYLLQEIQVFDPNGCLPERLLRLNLSSSPFMPGFSKNYTFLSCPKEIVGSKFKRIECMSSSSTSVLATSSVSLARGLRVNCSILGTVSVPVSFQHYSEWLTSWIDEDLRLIWSVPTCSDCESRGGFCRIDDKSSDSVLCYKNARTGKPRGLKILKVVALSITIPAIVCSIAIASFIFMVERRRTRESQVAASAEAPPPAVTALAGLDDSTIESYTKVILGESKRLPGPNGTTCPICLADYHTKDTLRYLPECEHCFHSECIDEWLRRHGSCPVCRNLPLPTHANM